MAILCMVSSATVCIGQSASDSLHALAVFPVVDRVDVKQAHFTNTHSTYCLHFSIIIMLVVVVDGLSIGYQDAPFYPFFLPRVIHSFALHALYRST